MMYQVPSNYLVPSVLGHVFQYMEIAQIQHWALGPGARYWVPLKQKKITSKEVPGTQKLPDTWQYF